MGLGTGGIYLEHSAEVFIEAYLSGYRLLDLAREYRNEHLVHEALLDDHAFRSSAAYRNHHQSAKQQIVIRKPPRRSELFLETKVWPTDLGFLPTSQAIETSLREVRSNYIDMYLLHWPRYRTWQCCSANCYCSVVTSCSLYYVVLAAIPTSSGCTATAPWILMAPGGSRGTP